MNSTRMITLTSILSLGTIVSGCEKSQDAQDQTNPNKNTDQQSLVVGFQKSQITLLVARKEKLLEQSFPNTKIEWKEFPAGPQLLEALSAGSLDIGSVGNIPPIFAQAANKSISYVAYEQVPKKALGLIVDQASPIHTLKDLKGKKIALQKGSSAHDFLNKVLVKAALKWEDISPIWLAPAEARAAFTQKSIDAWVSWDPYLSVIERDSKVRTLIDDEHFPDAYQFYIANPKFLSTHPTAVPKFIQATHEANTWIAQHPQEALNFYSKTVGLDSDIAKKYLDKRPSDITVKPIDALVIKSQQTIADTFFQEKLMPTNVDIAKAVWK